MRGAATMAARQARSGRAAQRRASACDGCRVAAARCAPQQPEGAMGAQNAPPEGLSGRRRG